MRIFPTLKKERQTIWIAFLRGKVWLWSETREDLGLTYEQEFNPDITVKQFKEMAS